MIYGEKQLDGTVKRVKVLTVYKHSCLCVVDGVKKSIPKSKLTSKPYHEEIKKLLYKSKGVNLQ